MTDLEVDPLDYTGAPDPDAGKVKNLYQKLADIVLCVGYIQKRGRHAQGFHYTRNIDIRQELREELSSRNIILTANCTSATHWTKDTGKQEITYTETKMVYEFINGDNPTERLPCEWMGWAEGYKAYNAFGAFTGAQRHFLESFFMLLTGEKDPEAWSAEQEAALVRIREEDARHALAEAKASGKANVVGKTDVKSPTKEDLEDIDPTPKPGDRVEEPEDEYWREFPLVMCKGLEDAYPGKHVGDIQLKHLIDACYGRMTKEGHRIPGFVTNVDNRVPGYISVGHQHLASALVNRMEWEIKKGNIIREKELDGGYAYRVAKR